MHNGFYLNFNFLQFVVRILLKCRSSHPEVFLGKVVLKICSKFTGEHPCRSAIFEIALRHGCSPVNLLHIFRTTFFKSTSEGLLLKVKSLHHLAQDYLHTHLLTVHIKTAPPTMNHRFPYPTGIWPCTTMFSWQSGCPECLIQKISCVFTRVIRSLVDFLQVRNQPDQYPAAIYLSKASSGNTRKLCEICSKQTMKTRIDVNFFSLFLSLLTSNRFYALLRCVHSWLWRSKCRLGSNSDYLQTVLR